MKATARKIRIGQLGIGHLHAYKIQTLRQFPEVFDMVGVAEDDPQQRAAFGHHEMYKGLRWMSGDELLSLPDLDAVLVETEEHDLVPTAMRCIRAGKHIHLDKPGGESLPPFQELLAEAEKRGLAVQMGYMYRNSPAVQFCIDAVKAGLLGNISTFDAVMSRHDDDELRRVIKTFKAGAPYIFICHLIDLAVIMLGAPNRIIPLLTCTKDDGVVDNGLAVMEFPQGCTATLRTSIVEVGGFERRNLVICGDKGSLVVQPLELQGNRAGGKVFLNLLENSGDFQKGLQEVHQPPLKGRYDDQLLEFARIVRGEITNPYSYGHELLVQQCLLEACRDRLGEITRHTKEKPQ
ncbi:MAG: Gfo/Idh/MocA family oxidoreductase [Opitutaceae bacterium]